MALTDNFFPSTALRSPATFGEVLPPLSPLVATATTPSVVDGISIHPAVVAPNGRLVLETDADAEEDNSDVFYDLYLSPCRGILRASNDELLDHIDLNQLSVDERNYIISYNNNDGGNSNQDKDSDLYKAYYYYYDDMEYCGTTFYGGCRFPDLKALENVIRETENNPESPSSDNSSPSYVTWNVMYDYELHYADAKRSEISNDAATSEVLSANEENQQEQVIRADPIPALEYLETIILEHLAEVVGLTRRGCDPNDSSMGVSKNRRSYQHDFSDEELERMLTISSKPYDYLDPDHVDCIVPVAWVIAETADCIPVTGGISIHLNTTGIVGSDTEDDDSSLANLKMSIESGFQRLIRFGMQQDLYVSGEADVGDSNSEEVLVKHVSFIGVRVIVGDDDEPKKDEIIYDTKGEDEDEMTTETEESSPIKDEDEDEMTTDTEESSPINESNRGIDENKVSSRGRVAIFLPITAIIVLAFIFVARTKRRQNADNDDSVYNNSSLAVDKGVNTPVDIEQQVATNDASVAESPARSGKGGDHSFFSQTTIEEAVFEDGASADSEYNDGPDDN